MLYRPRLNVILIRPLSLAFFLLALIGAGTTSFDPDAALAQTHHFWRYHGCRH